ncbi:unnamed protein product [Didymodactylos carnosus]|uniref:Uncharacterized protein n=1 Tax=Didymodactylos carnosus TaxID=1234261 RepID=A0A814XV33_9BILA|nr:unnamed protein product [Didymodactylos carnosus]CAF3984109.1 unnamed protein product [Didymodactylos carnosus]
MLFKSPSPPAIPFTQSQLKQLLEFAVCNIPFRFLDKVYIQTDGSILDDFCSAVNNFTYSKTEESSKPHLDLTIAKLREQNNTSLPLTSINFEQYRLILYVVDILSICFATEVHETTHIILKKLIEHHNRQFQQLYPTLAKPKYHFCTHLPYQVEQIGPQKYTKCLSTERKHQQFKGVKMRNFLNLPMTLSTRHELWISIIDHNEDGTLSTTVLHDPVEFKLSDNELTDQDVIQVLSQLNLPFDPVAMIKSIKIDGIEYRENALIYVADHPFRALPQFGEVKYIVNNETDVLFVIMNWKR